jgi:hypothetical protein
LEATITEPFIGPALFAGPFFARAKGYADVKTPAAGRLPNLCFL